MSAIRFAVLSTPRLVAETAQVHSTASAGSERDNDHLAISLRSSRAAAPTETLRGRQMRCCSRGSRLFFEFGSRRATASIQLLRRKLLQYSVLLFRHTAAASSRNPQIAELNIPILDRRS